MPEIDETIEQIVDAESWDERVARVRQVPHLHGIADHSAVYAEVARRLIVPNLSPDFAYVHQAEFYELPRFLAAYEDASRVTERFTRVSTDDLTRALEETPAALLVFRTITGLTKNEFAASTALVAEPLGLKPLSSGKVDAMEKRNTATSREQASVAARTIHQVMAGTLFSEPEGTLTSKQNKPDTIEGWETVRRLAREGVPYSHLLHQRHYGGAFRQVLDATSEKRGNLIEDAVEELFRTSGVPYIRTGSHNQGEIEKRFELSVHPAPDFVVFDDSGSLRGILECKGANDGGTARDKALRFERLREEGVRLGGVPTLAVLGGLGWTRVNDTLGPVVRDCEARVFTLSTLTEILTVTPFPRLVGTASKRRS